MANLSRRQFATALAATPLAAVLAPARAGSTVSGRLAQAAIAGGREFGAAVRADRIADDAALARLVVEECLSITPEFSLNWNQVERHRGRRRYEAMDAITRFAYANGKALRGHTLLWDLATPDWARRRLRRGDWRPAAAHFADVMTRYPTVTEWHVVNEAIDTAQGEDGYRRTSGYRGFGPAYIAQAFAEARRHAPAARLILNEYSLEYDNPVDAARRDMLLRIAERLAGAGLIDGIGLQAHLDLAKGRVATRAVDDLVRAIGDLGLGVTVTELDVKEVDRTAPLALRDARVADTVAAFLDTVLAHPHVRGVVTWSLSDRDSWLQHDQFADNADPVSLNRGLPFDAALQPTAMAGTIARALRANATGSS